MSQMKYHCKKEVGSGNQIAYVIAYFQDDINFILVLLIIKTDKSGKRVMNQRFFKLSFHPIN